jgi:hypothetical protein
MKFVILLILNKELRDRFDSIWTHQDGNKIIVEKISPERRRELEKCDSNEIRKTLDLLLGFTKVFRLLVEFKKPLIFHNGFMDLLYMYDKVNLATKFFSFFFGMLLLDFSNTLFLFQNL